MRYDPSHIVHPRNPPFCRSVRTGAKLVQPAGRVRIGRKAGFLRYLSHIHRVVRFVAGETTQRQQLDFPVQQVIWELPSCVWRAFQGRSLRSSPSQQSNALTSAAGTQNGALISEERYQIREDTKNLFFVLFMCQDMAKSLKSTFDSKARGSDATLVERVCGLRGTSWNLHPGAALC